MCLNEYTFLGLHAKLHAVCVFVCYVRLLVYQLTVEV